MRQPAQGVHSIQAWVADIQDGKGEGHSLPADGATHLSNACVSNTCVLSHVFSMQALHIQHQVAQCTMNSVALCIDWQGMTMPTVHSHSYTGRNSLLVQE